MSHRFRWTVWLGLCILAGCGGDGGGGSSTPSSSSSSSGSTSSSSSSSSGSTSSSSSSSGGITSSSSSSSSSGATVTNVVPITVTAGPPAAQGGTFNIPYASVKLCRPGTTTCATINNVLVDTGSTGLRIMASALAATGLPLTDMPDPSSPGKTIAECLPFADGYTWGPIVTADVGMGGEVASNLSVNIIDDTGSYGATVPTSCTTLSSSTNSLNSVVAFAANGVLGVGTFDQDCGNSCAFCASLTPSGCNTAMSDLYYSCNTASNSCAFTPVPLSAQVRDPVVLFATDNNGVILSLVAVAPAGAATGSGSMTFGIGTQSNNGLGSAFVLTADDVGNFTTTYMGQTLGASFIDSGSNGLFFPDSTITVCPSTTSDPHANDFFCPSSILSRTATNQGHDVNANVVGTTNDVPFQVVSLNSFSPSVYATSTLAGPATPNPQLGPYFDWGLPFFYGRSVFTAIEGKAVGSAMGPFYAY
jgi:hypothetical protein